MREEFRDKRLIAAGVIAVIGLAMLIAGSVMLGVGVHKAHQKSSCPTPPQCNTCPVCPTLNPTAVFTSSYSPSIQYTPDLGNPNSTVFQNTGQQLAKNITTALNSPVNQKASVLEAVASTSVVINSFQASASGVGVNFYASIIFPYNGMTAASVQTQMDTMYPTSANPSPTSQCYSMNPPPGQPAVNSTTTTTTTTPIPTTTTTTQCNVVTTATQAPPVTYPPGIYCDATGQNLIQVFLIDCAVPLTGTLDAKLASIRSFLNSYDNYINMHNSGSWGNVGFQYVTYTGSLIGWSNVCYDDSCWHTQVDALYPGMVNPSNDTSHYLSNGLQTVATHVVPNLWQARNLLIISDGFDITDVNYVTWANSLKAQYYLIDAFVVTQNLQVQTYFDQVVTSVYYRWYVSDWSYLQNSYIDAGIAGWTCTTTYPTPPPSTMKPTPPTLKTTTTTTTTTTTRPTTTRSGPLPIPNCMTDILFLVDESQSMIDSSLYDASLAYAKSLAYRISQSNTHSDFAIITFNSLTVYTSPKYVYYNDFADQVDNIPRVEGSTDFVVGFSAARDFIARRSRYSLDGVRSVLIFLSDGLNDNSLNLTAVQSISHDMRSNYATEIIALGVNETTVGQTNTKIAIDFGTKDQFVPSQYIDVTNSTYLNTDPTLNSTVNSITCKTPTTPGDCSSDIIFVIEVSEGEEDSNIEVERQTVNRLLNHYSGVIGPSQGEVSLIYFSAPDGLQNEYNRSGILYSYLTNTTVAQTLLNQKDFHPLGGASDVNLAMNMVLQVLSTDVDQNDQLVLFFGRGTYRDAPNCCDDPTTAAAAVRAKATVQGIVIGTYTNITIMNQITGSKSIDATTMLVQNAANNGTDIAQSAQALQNALIPIIDNHLAGIYCPPLPVLSPPCSQFDDIVLILHGSSASNWNLIQQFVTKLVIPALMGPLSKVKQGLGLPVNLAVITYFGQSVTSLNTFASQTSTSDIAAAILNTPFPATTETNSLSQAYKMAGALLSNSRYLTSKTVLVLSDAVDVADLESAELQRSMMPYSFVYGMKLNALIGDIIPGQDGGSVVSDIAQINPNSTRTSINWANTAAAGVCRDVPITTIAPVTVPTPRPTPGPVPPVKVRDVWPDVAILIDASNQNQSFFELQRQFLRNTFLNQYRIGENWSKLAVATYSNSTHIVCYFSEITNYWDLESCLGSQLTFSSVNPAVSKRDISGALDDLFDDLYTPSNPGSTGYRPLKTNYLYVLTNGASSTDFYDAATRVKSFGIRVVGIDISKGSEMSPADLSNFGPESFSVNKFDNPTINSLLSQTIVTQTTTKPLPYYSSMFSDFYLIVDNSFFVNNDVPNAQNFVLKFVEQLTVNPHRSRVSIVPYSYGVMAPLDLSDSVTAVMGYISGWKSSVAGAANSTIAPAIAYVLAQAKANPTRTAHAIFIVGATNATGAATASSLWSTAGVNTYVLNYNAVPYAADLVRDPSSIFTISSSSQLMNWVESQFPADVRGRNPMNQFFYQLQNVQEQADYANFPMKEVAADIMIFLDETGLTPADFASIKQFLKDFVNQFTIGSADTQVALQAFSEQVIPHSGWHFYDNVNNEYLIGLINNLTLTNSSTLNPADLSGAVEQALDYLLLPADGWREGVTTYSIIITNTNSFINDSSHIADLQSISQVYAVSLTGLEDNYTASWVNTDFYETTFGPQNLSIQSGAGQDLSTRINSDYKLQVYPPMPALNTINADFVFLIDNTNATADTLKKVNLFLTTFLPSVGNPAFSRVAVVNYNSRGVVQDQSWTLRRFARGDRTGLSNQINAMKITNDTNPPDLQAAVGYFSATPQLFGVDSSAPVFVISIFNGHTIKYDLPQTVMDSVNLNYFTFAIQYGPGNSQQFPYVPSFLGQDAAEDWLYEADLLFYSTQDGSVYYPLNSYIQSEYAAWKSTYGN